MKIVKDVFWLFLGNAVARLASGIFTIVLARYVGIDNYGVFILALSISAITAQVADCGIQQNYIRIVNQGVGDKAQLDSVVFWVRLLVCAGACLLAVACIVIFVNSSYRLPVILLVVPYVFGFSIFNFRQGVLMASHDMRSAALQRIYYSLFSVFGTALLLWFIGVDEVGPATVNALYGLGALFSAVIFQRKIPELVHKEFFRENLKRLFSGLGGFFWSGILYVIGPQAPILVLQYSASPALLGAFAFAYRLPLVLYMVPMSIVQSFYPKLIACKNNEEKYKNLMRVEGASVIAIGAIISIALDFSSPLISKMVADSDTSARQSLVTALSVMSWLTVIQSASIPFAHALMTSGLQGRRAIVQGLALAVAVPVLFIVTNTYNLVMIATSILCVEIFSLVLYGVLVRNSIGNIYLWVLIKVMLPYAIVVVLIKCSQVVLEGFGHPMLTVRVALLVVCVGVICLIFAQQNILKNATNDDFQN